MNIAVNWKSFRYYHGAQHFVFRNLPAIMITRDARLEAKVLSHGVVERKSSVWKISSERGEDSTGEFITRAAILARLYKIVGLPLHWIAQLWTGVAGGRLFIRHCAGTGVAFPNGAEPAQSLLRVYHKQLVNR